MLSEAISKIKAEMDGNKTNSYIQVVCQFLLKHLEANPEDAEKVMTADKTIAKSLDAMRTKAQKKKTGNFAMLTPDEGFAEVLKYFDIKTAPPKYIVGVDLATGSDTQVMHPASSINTPAPAANDFNVSLDDLLG